MQYFFPDSQDFVDPSFDFRPGDTVVLVGDRESLDKAAVVFKTPLDAGTGPLS